MRALRNVLALAAVVLLVLASVPAAASESKDRSLDTSSGSVDHSPPASGSPAASDAESRTVTVFPATDVPIAIPDNDPTGVTSTLAVPATGAIVDLNVNLDITHTWVGDLKVTLTHEATGTTAVLMDRPGVPESTFGCSADNLDAVFDDEGDAGPIEAACPPSGGMSYIPEEPLAAFDGEDLSGNWTLEVSDHAGGDTGFLNEWALIVDRYFCGGLPVTIYGDGGDNTLVGTSGNDVMNGLGGDDVLRGKGGDDVLCGGPGNDSLDGGAGSDRLIGQADFDTVNYLESPKKVTVNLLTGWATGRGTDSIETVEAVIGTDFNDTLIGNGLGNRLEGRKGNDLLRGMGSRDTMLGGPGIDILDGRGGNDILIGGTGTDIVTYVLSPAGVTVDLGAKTATGWGDDTLRNIENVIGSTLADELAGNGKGNKLQGGDGPDVLRGRGGPDDLIGGGGVDTAFGGAGVDTCSAETEVTCEL